MGIFSRGLGFFKGKKTFTGDEFIFKYLRNSALSKDININGSVTPVFFEYIVPEGKNAWITRVNLFALNQNIKIDTFFGVAPLTNGVTFCVSDENDNVLIDFTDGEGIKTNEEFVSLAGSDVNTTSSSLGNDADGSAIRWTISKAGEPLFLREGHKLRMKVSDDISDIDMLRAMIQGIIVDKF